MSETTDRTGSAGGEEAGLADPAGSGRLARLGSDERQVTQGPRSQLGLWPVHLFLLTGAILMVSPFLWEAVTSVKRLGEATRVPPTWIPEVWEWGNYAAVFDRLPFDAMYLNTILMTAGRTAGQLVFCSMAAYGFARLRFPGTNFIFVSFLAVLMVPPQLFLLPQFEIMADLGWLNTLQALTLPGMFSAFGTFLLRQFFMALPRDLEEAALLDGANPFQTFFHVALPLVRPGLLALTILTVLWSWNDLLWPLISTSDAEQMPLSAGLATLQGQYDTPYTILMAGSLLATAPVILVFVVLQKQFVEGIAMTGSKG